jgi:hypothetical protein
LNFQNLRLITDIEVSFNIDELTLPVKLKIRREGRERAMKGVLVAISPDRSADHG